MDVDVYVTLFCLVRDSTRVRVTSARDRRRSGDEKRSTFNRYKQLAIELELKSRESSGSVSYQVENNFFGKINFFFKSNSAILSLKLFTEKSVWTFFLRKVHIYQDIRL